MSPSGASRSSMRTKVSTKYRQSRLARAHLRATIRSARATSALTFLVTGLDLGRYLVQRHASKRRTVKQLHAAAVVRLVALTIFVGHCAFQEENEERVAVLSHGADFLALV